MNLYCIPIESSASKEKQWNRFLVSTFGIELAHLIQRARIEVHKMVETDGVKGSCIPQPTVIECNDNWWEFVWEITSGKIFFQIAKNKPYHFFFNHKDGKRVTNLKVP